MADGEDRDQRTEEATPRRKEESRRSGKVAYSQELVAAATGLAGMVVLSTGGPRLAQSLGTLLEGFLREFPRLSRADWVANDVVALVTKCVLSVGFALAAVIGPILVVIAVVAYGQVGFVIADEAAGFKPEKLNPVANAARVFSLRGLSKLGMGIAHLFVIGTVGAIVLWRGMPSILALAGSDLGPFITALGALAWKLASWVLGAGLALSLVDLFYQRWQHARDLRMSKDEIKREHKSSEGDPHVKARIRQIQREVSRRRMMQDVPRATVVVTNPTHVAVALAYPRAENGEPLLVAPKVVAKGLDAVAQRIKEVARESGVALHEDVRLARMLHRRVEIGEQIPEDLYTAVAEVLNYVYRVEEAARAA